MTSRPLFVTCSTCGETLKPEDPVCMFCGEAVHRHPPETFDAEPAPDFVFEEIGAWSQIKHEIVDKYLAAYMTILSKHPQIRRVVYVDGFAGTGYATDRETGELVMGSAARAMLVQPPFTELHLIERDPERAASLRRHVLEMGDGRVTVHEGDCVETLRSKVLPRCRYGDYARAICLLDPYGLSVPWTLLEEIAKEKSIEIFFNFMVVGLNRNVLYRDPGKVSEARKRIADRLWGDRDAWVNACYRKEPTLFDEDVSIKNSNAMVAEAFRQRLRTKAGFKFVPSPIPVRNDAGGLLYYLFFASHNPTAGKIVDDIFAKYRR